MTPPRSSKPLFRAVSGRASRESAHREAGMDFGGHVNFLDHDRGRENEHGAPEERRALDLYPTGEPEAIRALLTLDGERIRALGAVWEPAAGRGHLSREIEAFGLPCAVSDIADHGCPGVEVRSYYEYERALAPVLITNPPYNEINARDGHGRWLRHTLAMPGWRYCAFLLSWEWPAARANGFGALLDAHPFSWCYLMRWKLDFTGEGSPPQRNAWFVWDRDWTGPEPAFRFMDKALDHRQGALF